MFIVEVEERGVVPIFHAEFNGDSQTFGANKDLPTAVGDCLKVADTQNDTSEMDPREAANMELSGFTLPSEHAELPLRELGQLAIDGHVKDVSVNIKP